MFASLKNLKRCEDEVLMCFAKAERLYGITMPKVQIVADIKGVGLGGEARWHQRVIRVNPVYLETYTDDYVKNTVGHEAAHIITHARTLAGHYKHHRRVTSHGIQWQRVMQDLGLDPERCHNYKPPVGLDLGKRYERHRYVCSKCGWECELTTRKHNKMFTNSDAYHHRTCGEGVKLLYKPRGVVAKATGIKAPREGTKLYACYELYKAKPDASRKSMLFTFMHSADMTLAGARTYYNQCSNLHQAGVR